MLWCIFFSSKHLPFYPITLDQAGFNVKPVTESKRSFSGKFIGKVDVPRPTGKEVLQVLRQSKQVISSRVYQPCAIVLLSVHERKKSETRYRFL